MFKTPYQRGFSTFIILLILAALSSSIIGISVNKTFRQLSSLIAQQHTFSAETYAASMLNNIIFDYFAFGAHQHHTSSTLGWDFVTAEIISPILIKNKKFQRIELSVKGNHLSTTTFTYSVNLFRSRRLENTPNSALKYWPAADTHLLTQQYFNTDIVDFLNYQNTAKYSAESCTNLTPLHTGLLWIKGDCELTSLHLGKIQRPVILIVEEGTITVQQASVTGLIIHLCKELDTHSLSLGTGSTVVGGVLSSCTPPSNLLPLHFHPDVLNTLLYHQDNVLTQIAEGSWLKQ